MASLSIILPAYNEGEVIGELVDRVLEVAAGRDDWEIIVVDDGSTDETAARAQRNGVRVIRHPYNKGNGAAVKTGLRRARGEWVCLMDADGQHDPAEIPKLVEKLQTYEMAIGARVGTAGGGLIRWFGNLIYKRLASYLTAREIPDLTSGFRAAHRARMMEFLPLFPNGFSYPVTSTMAFIKAGYNVAFVPVDVSRRVGSSKIRLARDGVKFLLIAMRIIMLYSPMRIFFPTSVLLFLIGAAYGGYTVVMFADFTDMTVLMCLAGLLVFLIGLVSEQIALMRFERLP